MAGLVNECGKRLTKVLQYSQWFLRQTYRWFLNAGLLNYYKMRQCLALDEELGQSQTTNQQIVKPHSNLRICRTLNSEPVLSKPHKKYDQSIIQEGKETYIRLPHNRNPMFFNQIDVKNYCIPNFNPILNYTNLNYQTRGNLVDGKSFELLLGGGGTEK